MSRRPKPKAKPTNEPVPVSEPAQWHRRLAAVTGQLSMAVVKRSITKGQIEHWTSEIEAVREGMRAFSNRPRQ